MKTLMIVSGGDAPGINAVLARYTSLAWARGETVLGAVGGVAGALENRIRPLALDEVEVWSAQSGTMLASSRVPVLSAEGAEAALTERLDAHDIDGIVLFGGNGSLHHVFGRFADWGIPCIGIPTTIDNDVPGTEQTIGFDSACNFAHHSIDGLRATARALPGRIFMVETLGGDTGFLALDIAFAADADAVLVPEYDYTQDWLSRRLLDAVQRRGHALVVLSEGAKDSRTLADTLPTHVGMRVRDVRLGHAQRGSTPTYQDRKLAAEMAQMAFEALHSGVQCGVTVVRSGLVTLHEGTLDGFAKPLPNRALYDRVNGLS
jgi:6-phosphofructokinase 1